MPRTTRSTYAVAAVALLALTACGSRADSSLRQQAAAAALGGGGGTSTGLGTTGGDTSGSGGTTTAGTTTGGGTTGPATGGTATGGTTGGTSGTGTSGTSGTTTGGGTTSGTSGAPAPAGGNGGATDVGVTATSITLGNVSDVGGPRPGLFAGAPVGTQAYFAKINAEGGIFGRKLNLDVGDSQLDCPTNKQKTSDRVGKVFAFVGSFSLNDDCGTDILKTKPDIPDVHSALGSATAKLPSNFSIAPLGAGWRTGPLAYYNTTFGAKWKKIGDIYAGVGSGPTVWHNAVAAIKNSGGDIAHEESYGATDTDFTGAVVRMQSAGVQMIFENSTDGPTGARLVNAIKKQNLNWPIVFGATAYAPDFLSYLDPGAGEGLLNDQQFALFFNKDEAQRIPAVAEYQKWMKVVNPRQQMDLFSAYGWASAELFVQALKAAGPKATRASTMKALQGIHSFDASGMFAKADPAGKKPATCWILTKLVNGAFQRVSPATGFRCDGGYYNNPAAK